MAESFSVIFKADTRPVKKARDDINKLGDTTTKTNKSVKTFGQRIKQSATNVNAMGKASELAGRAVAALGAALSIRAFSQFANTSLQAALNIERQAAALAISAEEFQRLSFVFGQFGSDSADISDALNTLADRAQDAQDGMQSFVDDFKLVGIEVDDLRGRDPQGLFRLFAERVSQIQDPTRRAAGVVRILGDDLGRRLLPMLMSGTEGLDALGAQASVASDEVVAAAARIQTDIQEMTATLRADLSNVFLGFAAENEYEIRRTAAITLRVMGTVAQYADEVAGPLGAGLLGRIFLGKKAGVLFAAITGMAQMVNAIIDSFNETVGHQLADVEERIADLESMYEGMDIPPGVAAHLEDLKARQRELSAEVMTSIDLQNDYTEALRTQKDVGEEVQDVLFRAADRIMRPTPRIEINGSSDGQAGPVTRLPANGQAISMSDEDFFGALADESERVNRTIEAINDNLTPFQNAMLEIGDAVRDVSDTMEQGIGNALEDLIVRGESARDVFQALARDIATAILRQQVIDPAAQAITGAITGAFAGGGASAGASTTQMSNMSFLPGGAAANGGNAFRDRAMLVGERGPEVFVPGQDGRIIPNHQMGASPNVTVNVINEGGEPMTSGSQRSRRGPNGETVIDVMIKSSMERLDSQGQLDGIFRRHGAARQGQY